MELIERNQALYLNQDGILWVVTMKGQDIVIGLVGLCNWSYHNRAMLGYDLAHAYWGQGIASEAVREIIHFSYERMALNRIEAETSEDNHESRRMLEKIGFTLKEFAANIHMKMMGNTTAV